MSQDTHTKYDQYVRSLAPNPEVRRLLSVAQRKNLRARLHGEILAGASSALTGHQHRFSLEQPSIPECSELFVDSREVPLPPSGSFIAHGRAIAIAKEIYFTRGRKGSGAKPTHGKPKLAAASTADEKLTQVVEMYLWIYMLSTITGPRGDDARALLAAISINTPASPANVVSFMKDFEAATANWNDRNKRARRTALKILLQCKELPEVEPSEGSAPVHRPSYGSTNNAVAIAPELLAQVEHIDTRGLCPKRLQQDLVSLSALAQGSTEPDILALAQARNTRLFEQMFAVCVAILRAWDQNQTSARLPPIAGETEDLLAGAYDIQDPNFVVQTSKKGVVRHLSKDVACAAVLLLLLYGYNFESLVHGRFRLEGGQLFFCGRKPRADYASTKMRIDDELLISFFHHARDSRTIRSPSIPFKKVKTQTGFVYLSDDGWRLLNRATFSKWFADTVGRRLPSTSTYNYTSIRPLRAQVDAAGVNGELGPVKHQLHHKTRSETVGYVDSPEHRVRLDRQASANMACVEAICLAPLPDDALSALGLDLDKVRQAAQHFDARFPTETADRDAPFFNVFEPPPLVTGRFKKGHAMPAPPVANTAALWRASVALLRAAVPFLNDPNAAITNNVSITVDRGCIQRKRSFSPDKFIDLVDTATCVLLCLSSVSSAEMPAVLSGRVSKWNDTWRCQHSADGEGFSRPITASAAMAIRLHQLTETSSSWRRARKDRRAPAYIKVHPASMKALCDLFELANCWAERKLHAPIRNGWNSVTLPGKPLFTAARLRTSLATLWQVMLGQNVFPESALAYQCADHDNNRIDSTGKARITGFVADSVFSPALRYASVQTLELADLLQQSTKLPSTTLSSVNDNVPYDLAVPGWRRVDSNVIQLMLRYELIQAGRRHGIELHSSIKKICRWADATIGLRVLTGNSYTSKSLHGPVIQKIMGALSRGPRSHVAHTLADLLKALPADELQRIIRQAEKFGQIGPGQGLFGNRVGKHKQLLAVCEQRLAVLHIGGSTAANYLTGARKFLAFADTIGLCLFDPSITPDDVGRAVAGFVEFEKAAEMKSASINKNLKGLRLATKALLQAEPSVANSIQAAASSAGEAADVAKLQLAPSVIEAIIKATNDYRIYHKSNSARNTPADQQLVSLLASAGATRFQARNKALLLLAAATSLRVEEILSIDFDAVASHNSSQHVHLSVQQKGGSERAVVIGSKLAALIFGPDFIAERDAALSAAREAGLAADKEALFVSKNGKRLTRRDASRIMTQLSRLVGETNFTMHGLRRYSLRKAKEFVISEHASDPAMLANLAGHAKSKTTTDHYVGPMQARLGKVPVAKPMLAANDPGFAPISNAA